MIRYITGRGGSGIGGLSAYLATLDDDYDVLPIDPEFLLQDIQGQVDSTREFINFDSGNVIANSYGAYLLLLSLIDQPRSLFGSCCCHQCWAERSVKSACYSAGHHGIKHFTRRLLSSGWAYLII